VVVAIVLQIVLPETVIRGLGPRWFIPGLEGALLVALVVTNPVHIDRESRLLRAMSLTLIGIITVAYIVALGELVSALLNHTPRVVQRPVAAHSSSLLCRSGSPM
jgi:hypothetical protein